LGLWSHPIIYIYTPFWGKDIKELKRNIHSAQLVCAPYMYLVSKDQQVTRTRQQNKPLTRHTNTERATAQRRLVEVVVAAPKLPPSAALLLSSLLPTSVSCVHLIPSYLIYTFPSKVKNQGAQTQHPLGAAGGYISLYQILFYITDLMWESIIPVMPPPPANPTVLQYYCTTIAQHTPPNRPPFCMPYTTQYWWWQYRVKANVHPRCIVCASDPILSYIYILFWGRDINIYIYIYIDRYRYRYRYIYI